MSNEKETSSMRGNVDGNYNMNNDNNNASITKENNSYFGRTSDFLTRFSVKIGDTVKIKTGRAEFSGILIPRFETSENEFIVLKLKNGYNIGISIFEIKEIFSVTDTKKEGLQGGGNPNQKQQSNSIDKIADNNKSLPRVALISTGGTIASRVDYRTGGVRAALSAYELNQAVPEISNYATIEPEVLFNEYSENITPEHWSRIAVNVASKIKSKRYSGIIISHGTDTMHYTAAALSFALQNVPIPVVLVGAQRSSDRPSSDAAYNLIGAAIFAANSKIGGVFIAMHADSSDNTIFCHTGTRVRKNHTSRRDAFESIDTIPVASIKVSLTEKPAEISFSKSYSPISAIFELKPDFEKKVALIKYHPGFNPELILHLVQCNYKAIVLEGTGLGHVSRSCFDAIEKAIKNGIPIFMTSQCIWGRINMSVYDTGRDLLSIGVIPLSDMISETALVKAMWAFANSDNIQQGVQIMQKSIAGEISDRIPIYQVRLNSHNDQFSDPHQVK